MLATRAERVFACADLCRLIPNLSQSLSASPIGGAPEATLADSPLCEVHVQLNGGSESDL